MSRDARRKDLQDLPGSWRVCSQCGTPRWVPDEHSKKRLTCWMTPSESSGDGVWDMCQARYASWWQAEEIPAELVQRRIDAVQSATVAMLDCEDCDPDDFWRRVKVRAECEVPAPGTVRRDHKQRALMALPGSWRICQQCGTPRWIRDKPSTANLMCWMFPTDNALTATAIPGRCRLMKSWSTWRKAAEMSADLVESRTLAIRKIVTTELARDWRATQRPDFWVTMKAAAEIAVPCDVDQPAEAAAEAAVPCHDAQPVDANNIAV